MPTPNILGQYTNTYKLATALVKTFPQYKKYKPEQFIDMLQQIAISETGDRNIVQENKGPGRGHFQVETPRPGDKQNVAAITAYNRAKNTLEELKKYGSKENLTLPKYNEDFTKIDKDAQAFYTLSNMLGNAQQARKTDPKAYVDPTNPADSWRDYHWVGDRKAADYQKVKKERMQHWKETVVNYKPIVVETSKEAAPTTQAPKQAVPTQAPTQAPTTTPIGTFVPSIQNDPWLQKFEDGGSINDQKIPTPTTPSFYPAGQDRTLTNYQRGTPKAPMYAAGSTVWTNQNTPLWAAGTPTPTSTQNFRNTGSLNTSRYRIGDVIPTGINYKTPAAGTYDYSKDIQPYHTMRLHAPDTTMMARHGGHIKKHINSPRVYGNPVNPSGMYKDGDTVGGGGLIKAQTGKEKLPDGTSWFNQQVVQDANARMNATSTNSLGRVISTPESRFKERRGNYLVENPQKFTNADYLAGHKEEGLDNSVLSDPLAMAAALTAGGVGLGTYGLSQVPRMFLGNLASEATAGLTDVGKHLTRNTALRNTYKLNPWRFKPNPESFYRQIGNEGLTDALSSNTIRSANQSTFPRPHFVEGTDFTKLYSTGEGATGSRPSVIFETSGINQAGEPFVFPANSTSGYTPWIAGDATVPLSEGRILQKDWLRGYKEVDVSKQLPGSPNAFKDPINLDLFGFGRKKLTPLEKQTLLTQQELSRANKDALTFSQSAANKAKLQEFRPNQDFSVSNQQARYPFDPEAQRLYDNYKIDNDPNLSIDTYLGSNDGKYGARDYGDMDDVVLVNPNTNNIYASTAHETTHSRSIRLKATDAEKKIASDAWSPMIEKNGFGMPEEEAFAVQNELRLDKLKDIDGSRVYTEKDIPEIKKGLEDMVKENHPYLKGVDINNFNMSDLIKSLNKIGLGSIAIGAGLYNTPRKNYVEKQANGGYVKNNNSNTWLDTYN